MASESVTGATQEELDEMRSKWEAAHEKPFEKAHCLCEIPRQPPDYTGPVRYCKLRRDLSESPNGIVRCKNHGPTMEGNADNLEKLAAMKHGMKATREHLIEDFDDKDQALYDWIMSEWPDAYDIDFDGDPQAMYDFHRLAAEVVRGERGRGFLIQEGEVQEEPIRNEEGRVVIGDDGGVVTEKSQHYLADMLARQDSKISDLEKELGISRKERLRQDNTDSAVEAIKGFTELGSAFLDRDENEYDPDDAPWENEQNS